MGVIVRQSVKGTIATYAGVLVGAFNILWLFPKMLEPSEIGLINIIINISLLLAFASQLGTNAAVVKFFPFLKDHENHHNGFLPIFLLIPLAGFTMVATLFLIFRDEIISAYNTKSPELEGYILQILPFTFFTMYLYIFEAYSRALMRIVVPAIIKEVLLKLVTSTLVILYFMNKITMPAFINILIISNIIGAAILVLYIKHMGQLYLQLKKEVFSRPIFKEILRYCFFMSVAGAGVIMSEKIDGIMLGAMLGLSSAGIYSIAYFIGTVIEIPKRNIIQVSTPLVSQAWKEGNMDKILELYQKTTAAQMIAGILLFVLVWCNVDDLLSLIPNSEQYSQGKYVIFFIGLGRLFDMFTGNNGEIIFYSPKYVFNVIGIVILAGLTVITNYLLIPVYGLTGAAIATCLSLLMYNLLKFLFIVIQFGIQPYNKKSIYLLIAGAALLTAGSIMPDLTSEPVTTILQIGIKSLILISAFLGVVYFLEILPEYNQLVMTGLRKARLRK